MKYQDNPWNPEIEYLRGIAILFIIAIHSFGYCYRMNFHNFLFYFNTALDVFSHIGVPIFVFVSGFVLAIKYHDDLSLKDFYKKRIPKIVIPYVTFSIFYLLGYQFLLRSQLLQNQRELSQLTLNEVFFRLISGTAHYHLWFIILILTLYILYPLIIKIYGFFSKSHKEHVLLIIFFSIQSMMCILNHYYPTTDLFFLVFLSYIFYFVLGIFLSYHYSEFKEFILHLEKKSLSLLLFINLGFTIILTFIFVQNYTINFENHYLDISLVYPLYFLINLLLLFSLICSLEHSAITPLKEFLMSVSKYSFGIFLIHPFFIEAVYYLVMPRIAITVDNWIFYPILFISALIFSVLALKILKKIPHASIFIGMK